MTEKGYQSMRGDKKVAVASWSNTIHSVDAVDMISFDFQQNLPTPHLHHNDVFYARQLWTYNFGIHDCVTEKGTCSCGTRQWQSVVHRRSPPVSRISFRPSTRVLDLWFLILMVAVGKTKMLLSLPCTTNSILAGSTISLIISSSRGVTSSSGLHPNREEEGKCHCVHSE